MKSVKKSLATPNATPGSKKPRVRPPRQEKPYPEFPLYWHPSGYWMKKEGGRELRYTSDAHESLRMWNEHRNGQKDRSAPVVRRAYLLRDAVNLYLSRQLTRNQNGKLSDSQMARCRLELERMLPQAVSLSTPLSEFVATRPHDPVPAELFQKIRAKAYRRGLSAAKKNIDIIRATMKYAAENAMMGLPAFGDNFDPPEQAEIDDARHKMDAKHGERSWDAMELRQIIAAAEAKSPQMHALVLLGIFAGFGSDDCCALTDTAFKRTYNAINFRRVKTKQQRANILPGRVWAALDKAIAVRPEPAREEYARHVFLKPNGFPMNYAISRKDKIGVVTAGRNDRVGVNFGKLVKSVGLARHRTGFKTLRSCCRTLLMGGSIDPDIISVIMGRKFAHATDAYYVRGDLHEKLVAAAEHIERQIYGD